MQMKLRIFMWMVALLAVGLLAACANAGAGDGITPSPFVDEVATPTLETPAPAEQIAVTGECADVETEDLIASGQTTYANQCAGCHGQEGQGAGGFPALEGDEMTLGGEVSAVVEGYYAVGAHPRLGPEELAAVLTYVRNDFSETERAVVCPADVAEAQPLP
jgi:mono/diheme cytochrome c family protein